MSNTVVAKAHRQVAFTIAQFAKATNLSLLSIDGKGDIEFANPSACKLFGYKQSEMIGQPIMIIIPERLRGAHKAGMQRVAGGQAPLLGGPLVEVLRSQEKRYRVSR